MTISRHQAVFCAYNVFFLEKRNSFSCQISHRIPFPAWPQGVVLTGTYKLDVGGISLYDWRDGHEVDGNTEYDLRKSSRKLTSIGSLRISALEETLQHGQARALICCAHY